jgi:hypothetical protein
MTKKWSRVQLNVQNRTELRFKIAGGGKVNPDFALSLYFVECDVRSERNFFDRDVIACGDQENEIADFSLPVYTQGDKCVLLLKYANIFNL